jgi:EthD domain
VIKVVMVLRRKPGMNLAAFTEYWRTTHAAAVMRVPKIRR